MQPAERISPAALSALEGVKLARRELACVGDDPERWRWVAVGLVAALKAACIAALSGYETALPEDVEDPKQSGHVAPVALLLRRVRSERYLSPPEKLSVPGAQIDAALRLVAYRNEAVHGFGAARPDSVESDAAIIGYLLRHLLIDHPAFKADPVSSALLADEISALTQSLGSAG